MLIVLFCLFMMNTAFAKVQDGPPRIEVDPYAVSDPTPQVEPISPTGNPPFYDVLGKRYYVDFESTAYQDTGLASWYGAKFHGRRTSSGEPYNLYGMTAAHRTLPLPTYAKVTNLENGRSITVKINDRGPFHEDRIIDLSYMAAKKLDILKKGTAPVFVEALTFPSSAPVQETQTYSPCPQTVAQQYYLQAGAFGELKNATAFMKTIEGLTNLTVKIAEPLSEALYRVHIGPLTLPADCEALTTQLAAQGVKTFAIPQR